MKNETIHAYARCNMNQSLRDAIQDGADINEKDEFGSTALQYAIAEKNIEGVKILLELGTDITVQDKKGMTALHWAIEHKLPQVLEWLVSKNPKAVSIGDKNGNEPLWVAAFNARDNYEMVLLLMENGADPTHLNRVKKSPLDLANKLNDKVLMGILEKKEM